VVSSDLVVAAAEQAAQAAMRRAPEISRATVASAE
jgi:hypothetical protein